MAVPENLEREKRMAVKIAKELHYGDNVIAKIKEARTSLEIDRILHDARVNM